MAHIVDKSNKIVSDMRDTPVVQEFLDMFPNSFPRLTPEKEVKFSIELALETMPILTTPYKMALTKLQELKKQL